MFHGFQPPDVDSVRSAEKCVDYETYATLMCTTECKADAQQLTTPLVCEHGGRRLMQTTTNDKRVERLSATLGAPSFYPVSKVHESKGAHRM